MEILSHLESQTEGYETLVIGFGTILAFLIAYAFYLCGPTLLQVAEATWYNSLAAFDTSSTALTSHTIHDNDATNYLAPGSYIEYPETDADGNIIAEINEPDLTRPFPQWTSQDVAVLVGRYKQIRIQNKVHAEKLVSMEVQVQMNSARENVATARAEQAERVLQQYEEQQAQVLSRPGSWVMREPEYVDQIRGLHRKVHGLESELAECRVKKERTIRPKEIDGYRLREKEAARELARSIEDADKYRKALRKEERRHKAAVTQLKAKERQMRDFRAKVGTRGALAERAVKAEAENAELKSKIEVKDIEIQYREAKIDEAEAQIAELELHVDELEKSVADRDTTILEANGKLAEQKQTIKKHEEVSAAFMLWINNLQAHIKGQNKHIEDQDQAVNSLRQSLNSAEKKKTDVAHALKQSEEHRIQNQKRTDEIVALHQKSAAQATKITDENTKLALENIKLVKKIEELEKQRANGINKKDERIHELEEKLKTAEASPSSDNNSSTPCSKCDKLQAEVNRLTDLSVFKTPTTRVQQLIERDAKIEAFQNQLDSKDAGPNAENDEVVAVRKKIQSLEEQITGLEISAELLDSSADVEQRDIWLEEVRVALCKILALDPGTAQVQPNEHADSYPQAEMLQTVLKKDAETKAEVDRLPLLESNMSHVRDENKTLKTQLEQTQAELRAARAPTDPKGLKKGDPKVKEIMHKNQRIEELETEVEEKSEIIDKLRQHQCPAQVQTGHQADAEATIEELEDELAQIRENLKLNEETMEEMEEEHEAAKKEAEAAKKVLQEENRRLAAELEKAKKERDDCRDKDLPDNQEKVKALENELATVNKSLGSAHADLEDLEKELNSTKEELDTAKEGFKTVGAELVAARKDADGEAQEKIRSLTTELNNAKTSLNDMQTTVQQAQVIIDETERKYDAARSELEQAKPQLDIAHHAHTEQQRQLQMLTEHNASLVNENNAARQEVNRIHEEAIAAARQGGDEIMRLRNEITNLVDKHNIQDRSQKLQIESLSNDVKHWAQQGEKARADNKMLYDHNIRSNDRLKQLLDEVKAKEGQIKILSDRVAEADKVKQATLSETYGDAGKTIDGLHVKIAALQADLTSTREIKTKYSNQLDLATNDRARLQLELSDLRRERDQLFDTAMGGNTGISEAVTLRQQLQQKEQRFQDMSTRWERQFNELSQKANQSEQELAAFRSKYQGFASSNMVPASIEQRRYADLQAENLVHRQEIERLKGWIEKIQPTGSSMPPGGTELHREQVRRAQAEGRLNVVNNELADTKKTLKEKQACYEEAMSKVAPDNTGVLKKAIGANTALQARMARQERDHEASMEQLTSERDALFQQIQQMQQDVGNVELAQSTEALRVQKAKNAELQQWKDNHLYLVAVAESQRDKETVSAAAQMQTARTDIMNAGFQATRGTMRKHGEVEVGDSPSSPRRDSKTPKLDDKGENIESKANPEDYSEDMYG